jgi:hypothetical protein
MQTRKRTVGGVEIVIHEATHYMAILRGSLILEADKLEVDESSEMANNLVRHQRTFVYPSIVACTTCENGKLPTFEEFLQLSAAEVDGWVTDAIALNKGWFEFGGGEDSSTVAEKKRRRRK